MNADRTFDATASRDRELAETIRIFPTFLDESKATVERVARFSTKTRPVIHDLKAPADDLAPTVRELGGLSPDLEQLFRDLGPLINASEDGLPALTDVTKGLGPFLESAHPFFQQLNPILSYFNFHQRTIAGFITNGGADLVGTWGTGRRGQTQIGILTDPKNFTAYFERPPFERGNAYLQPNALKRAIALGGFESFDCNPSGGEVPNAQDAEGVPPPLKGSQQAPPCLIAPPSLYDDRRFNFIDEGEVRTDVRRPRPARATRPPSIRTRTTRRTSGARSWHVQCWLSWCTSGITTRHGALPASASGGPRTPSARTRGQNMSTSCCDRRRSTCCGRRGAVSGRSRRG